MKTPQELKAELAAIDHHVQVVVNAAVSGSQLSQVTNALQSLLGVVGEIVDHLAETA